jgi:hypothetical protein
MKYDIEVEKKSSIKDLHEANAYTSGHASSMGLSTAYHLAHSTIRTQLFDIMMHSIPTKVSVHFVRHSATGQLHYVKTKRKDRTMHHDTDVHRLTPVEHKMVLNAEHLIDISRKRLCNTSDAHTVQVMKDIKEAIKDIDPALARYMQPDCVYRGGFCYQGSNCCGYMPKAPLDNYERIISERRDKS